eukprot:jgi/Tetstr1/446259/TSEL_033803.t1
MLVDRVNIKGSYVSLDFNTISITTAALGLMCKRAINPVSHMYTSGGATNMQATQVVAKKKMTYSPDHMEEYKGLTQASAKDLAQTFMVGCNFLHHVSPLGLDTDQVLTMINSGRAARSKH